MRKTILLKAIACMLVLSSCSDDDSENLIDFTVGFSSSTVSTTEEDTSKEIVLNFSRSASEDGTITVSYSGDNAEYGTDFTTSPDGSSGTISVPVASGDTNASFTFNKLTNAIEGTTKSVTFTLDGFSDADWSTGSTASAVLSYTPIAATSGIIDTENGGSNQPNQVYFDFSTGVQTAVRRDTWEIGLYNGAENRVFLNNSLSVSAVELTGVTDLLSITEASDLPEPMDLVTYSFVTEQLEPVNVTTVAELAVGLPIGYGQYGNINEGIIFTDNAEGTLEGTVFSEISTTPEENYVYLVSLGKEIPTDPAPVGSIATTGDPRPIIKVRILSDGNNYTIQYADLNETSTISEVTVPKDDTYNITAFSLTNGETVSVEPAKEQWDINLSGVFTYYGYQGPIAAGLTFSDYVVHNTMGGVGLYQVTIEGEVPTYANFTMSDVEESAFVYDNRAVVGSGWRDPFGGVISDDRYYVIKDIDGNYYKLNFTAYTNAEGERGHFQFTYERL